MREIIERLEEATGAKFNERLALSLLKSMYQRAKEMQTDYDNESAFMDGLAIFLAEISGILKKSGGPYARIAAKVASASNELTDIGMKGLRSEGLEEAKKPNPAFVKSEVGIIMQLIRSVKDTIDFDQMQSVGALGASLDRIAILTRGFGKPKFKKAAKLIDKAVEALIEEE